MKKNGNSNGTPNRPLKPAPSTPIQSMSSSTQASPYSPGGQRLSASRSNIHRAESPNCTTSATNTIFIETATFEKRFSSTAPDTRIPFLFRELGLRLLYNSENDNYYGDLRSRNSYQTDFTDTASNTDYAHKLFSNIRNNHRYLKSCIKRGLEVDKTENEILFSSSIKIREYYRSKPYLNKGSNYYLDTLDHVAVYLDSAEYDSYEKINSLILRVFGDNYIAYLVENFKRILKGEVIDDTILSEEQVKIIYTLFYHLFVIEGSRDPASYITIPLALEFLSENPEGGMLLESSIHSPGVIPICFTRAMQALSYMGDVTFQSLTSIQYSHSYNGTRDYVQQQRVDQWGRIQQKTNNLLRNYLKVSPENEFDPDFSSMIGQIMDVCKAWYGFEPRMEPAPAHPIQFFQQLGLIATDVPRDGNCFFYVLRDFLNALPAQESITHVTLREIAAELLDDDRIKEDKKWINLNFANIARVLAERFHVNIVLVQQDTVIDQVNHMIEHNFYYGGYPTAPSIYIGNIGNMHFVQLNPEEGQAFNQLRDAVQQHIESLQQVPADATDAAVSGVPEAAVAIAEEGPLGDLNDMAKAILESSDDEPDEEAQDESEESDDSEDDESEGDATANSAMEWIEDNEYEDAFQLFKQRVADNAAATNHASQYESIAHAYRACCEGDVDEEEEHALIAAYNGQYDNSDNEQDDDEDEYQDDDHEDLDDVIVNCLYNINYTNPSISILFDSNNYPDKNHYQLSALEEHFLNNFVVNSTIEKQSNTEQQEVFLAPSELSHFNFEEMSLIIGKILSHLSQ